MTSLPQQPPSQNGDEKPEKKLDFGSIAVATLFLVGVNFLLTLLTR